MAKAPLHPLVLKVSKEFSLSNGDILLTEALYTEWLHRFAKAPRKERERNHIITSLVVVTRHMLTTGAHKGPRQLATFIYLLGGQKALADGLTAVGFDRSAVSRLSPFADVKTPTKAGGLSAPAAGISVRRVRRIKSD